MMVTAVPDAVVCCCRVSNAVIASKALVGSLSGTDIANVLDVYVNERCLVILDQSQFLIRDTFDAASKRITMGHSTRRHQCRR